MTKKQRFVYGFPLTTLAPGEERDFTAVLDHPFTIERLVVPRFKDPPGWRWKRALGAICHNIFFFPWIFAHWLRFGEWLFLSLYFPAPDDRVLLDIVINEESIFDNSLDDIPDAPRATGISLACFEENAYDGGLFNGIRARADARQPITFVVKNYGDRPTNFQAGVMGMMEFPST